MVISAALVILLSAFNGIESMINSLYTAYDQDITISSREGKTFPQSQIDWKQLEQVPGVFRMSQGLEEMVILRHEKSWINATLVGVEPDFLNMIEILKQDHLLLGQARIKTQSNYNYGIIGAGLANKLSLGSVQEEPENTIIYAPKSNMKLKFGKNPFHQSTFLIGGIFNYNKETNDQIILTNLKFTQELLNKEASISHIYIQTASSSDNEQVKTEIKDAVGDSFVVKTNAEKNELIYKTSKSEKLIVIAILFFIFLLASFNLVASITMLFIEKKDNLLVLQTLGLNERKVFSIFFYEGILISSLGLLLGIFLGTLICWLQIKYHLLTLPGSNLSFPMVISYQEIALIGIALVATSTFFSFLTAKYLIRNLK